MSRIYVASSWRNQYQPDICKALLSAGHQIYDFRNPPGQAGFKWQDIEEGWQSWSPQRYKELLHHHPAIAHGFVADLRGMLWADTCVLVLPCGRSAHLEAGWFAGANRRLIILMLTKEEPDLMYLFAQDIVFSVDELLCQL
jgi:hypothetical protein